jgi:hypothetical protein
MKKDAKRALQLRLENAKVEFPEQTVRLELYRLACHFFASKKLRDLSDGTDWCPYQPLRSEFQRAEIIRILLYVAISGRLLGDKLRDWDNPEYMEKQYVGGLVADLTSGKNAPLNLRECCNKIIHAKQIVLSERLSRDPYRAYLRPTITLYSDDARKSGWKAQIDVEKFVAEFSRLAT